MLKRCATVVFSLLFLFSLRVDAFTVVTKNGKTLTGTLISETADGIVFKDDKGFQFSFKKSMLDLAKMADANKPPAPAPKPATPPPPPPKPVEAQPQSPGIKKPARVYTDQDILRLKGVDTGGLLEPGVPDTGDPYANAMHSAAAVMSRVLDRYQSIAAQAISAWEVASSTGGDPNAAMQKFVQGTAATTMLHNLDADIARLNSLRSRVAGADDQGGPAADAFDQALKVVSQMRSMLVTPHVLASSDEFENQVSNLTTQLVSQSSILQNVQASGVPAQPTQEQPPPPQEDQPDPNAH